MIKIWHERKVEVAPCANFGEALAACHSNRWLYALQKSVLRSPLFKQSSEERELEEMCRQEIPGERVGEKPVHKTLAVALLDGNKKIADLSCELNEMGFLIPSISAAAAFVPLLRQRGVPLGPIPHLGSLIHHEGYLRDAFFVSRPKGYPEVRILFPGTEIKQRNSIIIEKIEKKAH